MNSCSFCISEKKNLISTWFWKKKKKVLLGVRFKAEFFLSALKMLLLCSLTCIVSIGIKLSVLSFNEILGFVGLYCSQIWKTLAIVSSNIFYASLMP